ncbi:type 2 lantipeptide synthetase LanM family protein [Pseudomonas sp. MG-9]|uniref:type 2 lanthipeptide synthetase LanM family protein n=1 Tax=Pseudomonas sp. MG-9 TaxID=2839032 RepID=UPI001C004193|nr:type 2 lanthipeptide synthetase LanM family protein [Pseudomonas sp. MG-9]MBT9267341.1 type 2 lantipeptide synthetase LanM family protein [Pseudomonas sp. MG-9]
MLADILTFQERKSSGSGGVVDVDTLRSTLDMLHKDDHALLLYFGMGKSDLVEWFENSTRQPVLEKQFPSLEMLEKKIRLIMSVSEKDRICNAEDEPFSGFYDCMFDYFRYTFQCDSRYKQAHDCCNLESLISGVRYYVSGCVKRLSEKSLVHFLNTRISEGVESDLGSFEQYLNARGSGQFLLDYPVLADLLIKQLEGIAGYLYKIISHFADDLRVLAQVFDLSGRRIDSIKLGMGDPHANGETVCAVRVGNESLVYKPRRNGEAQLYSSLLALLYEKSADECFSAHTPLLACMEDHCWIENIDNRACETQADLALFYRRAGAQIALVHALNGIDFHYENIIACGSSPVMIDLECLFTASMIDLQDDLPSNGALFKTLKLNSLSVFSSGFVPYSPDSDNDFSGLTSQKQFSTTTRHLVREQGLYHLRRIQVSKTPIIKHLPVFNGVPCSVELYQEAFLEGFVFAYDEVMTHQAAVLDCIRHHASQLKTRVLLKNTQRYIDFIELTLHPRFTQCMLQRQLLLATLWSESNASLIAKNVAAYELADLQSANIPSFTMPIASNRIYDSHGTFVAALDIASPLESCQRKLSSFCSGDRAFQTFILKECLFPPGNEAMPMHRRHIAKGVPNLQPAQYLEGALKVAAVIERFRIGSSGGDVAWTFLNAHPTTRRKYLSPMTNSLYSGMGGLAVFYMSLYRVSGRAEHLARADQIVDSMARSHEHFDSDMAVSAYFGLASYLYVLVNHEQVTGRDIHWATINGLLLRLDDYPQQGDDFDFLNGWCGTVTLLANLYLLGPRKRLIPLIERLTAAIRAELLNEGGRFVRKACSTPLLTGFSHGISGILHALSKVYEVTADATLITLMKDLLEDENRQKNHGFWLDLREPSKPAHMTKWCHGDAGILIARLQLRHALKDVMGADDLATVESDIRRCESNLWRHGLGSGYSQCHGDFGNLMCLLSLYRCTENRQGIARTLQALSEAADNFFNEDLITQDSVPVLGMMLGVAGVGQALLSAIDSTLPDPLALTFFMAPNPAVAVQDRSGVGSSDELRH